VLIQGYTLDTERFIGLFAADRVVYKIVAFRVVNTPCPKWKNVIYLSVGRLNNETRLRINDMNSLIDNVLSLENDASTIIEKARVEAKELEKRVSNDITKIQQESQAMLEKKLVSFREEAGRRHEQEVAQQAIKAQQMLEKVDSIPAALIEKQIEKIVNRFREI